MAESSDWGGGDVGTTVRLLLLLATPGGATGDNLHVKRENYAITSVSKGDAGLLWLARVPAPRDGVLVQVHTTSIPRVYQPIDRKRHVQVEIQAGSHTTMLCAALPAPASADRTSAPRGA